jgi:hypothetical protein
MVFVLLLNLVTDPKQKSLTSKLTAGDRHDLPTDGKRRRKDTTMISFLKSIFFIS